jgi:ribose 5-phosphate isomerase B
MGNFNGTIAIACDHAGVELKDYIKNKLTLNGFQFEDYGTNSLEAVDYPDMIHPLARDINDGKFPFGVIICGSGNGVAMTANKYKNVRAAICWNEEITKLARLHNDANIISLPARFITRDEAYQFVQLFMTTAFEGGRHQRRVDKIPSR